MTEDSSSRKPKKIVYSAVSLDLTFIRDIT